MAWICAALPGLWSENHSRISGSSILLQPKHVLSEGILLLPSGLTRAKEDKSMFFESGHTSELNKAFLWSWVILCVFR